MLYFRFSPQQAHSTRGSATQEKSKMDRMSLRGTSSFAISVPKDKSRPQDGGSARLTSVGTPSPEPHVVLSRNGPNSINKQEHSVVLRGTVRESCASRLVIQEEDSPLPC